MHYFICIICTLHCFMESVKQRINDDDEERVWGVSFVGHYRRL